ncbi:hypothetical protein ABEB36_008324 [Hypothenemus hampei]|uniref:Uncharacterized protein n=1 Tax=Hypothenemus hampei TaxID=57062 RepID=A0ABD1ELI2_HYPHA
MANFLLLSWVLKICVHIFSLRNYGNEVVPANGSNRNRPIRTMNVNSFKIMNSSDFSKNSSHNITDYYPYDQRPETYFVPVLFFLIFVVGCVGNGTLVIIFLRHKKMRNVPNT